MWPWAPAPLLWEVLRTRGQSGDKGLGAPTRGTFPFVQNRWHTQGWGQVLLSVLHPRGLSTFQGQLTKGAAGSASSASASTSACPLPISGADGVREGAWGGQSAIGQD